MNLTLFFRLIVMSIFQAQVTHNKKTYMGDMCYGNQLFYCPKVYAKDGFNVSLQIHNGNYCSSENGYRTQGHTMQEVEFGFPSENESLMHKYAEGFGQDTTDYSDNENPIEIPFSPETFNIINSVGRIPVSVMEEIFIKHGGIDWEATISINAYNRHTKSE